MLCRPTGDGGSGGHLLVAPPRHLSTGGLSLRSPDTSMSRPKSSARSYRYPPHYRGERVHCGRRSSVPDFVVEGAREIVAALRVLTVSVRRARTRYRCSPHACLALSERDERAGAGSTPSFTSVQAMTSHGKATSSSDMLQVVSGVVADVRRIPPLP
jgi:hypothetical protein